MTKAARSLFFFGIYALITGTAFLVAPATLLSLMQLPAMPNGWARVVGILALVIGTYDIIAARAGFLPFIKATVWVRFAFAGAAVLLYLFGQMPVSVIALGAVDAAGAIWTSIALNARR